MQEKHFSTVIVMRHGERMDCVDENQQKFHKHDPELTEKGYKQAFSIGEQILFFLTENNKSLSKMKIRIVSSPFARTLQTAKGVIETLQWADKCITTDNGLSEYIKKDGFSSNPSNFLELLNHNQMLLKEFTDIKIEAAQPSLELPTYPEPFDKCLFRYRETHKRLVEKFIVQENVDLLIIVTHGYGVQIMSEQMQVSEDVFEYDFCSTHIFNYDQNQKTFRHLLELKPNVV
jgi:broad specificity phosphatase PhoE